MDGLIHFALGMLPSLEMIGKPKTYQRIWYCVETRSQGDCNVHVIQPVFLRLFAL